MNHDHDPEPLTILFIIGMLAITLYVAIAHGI